MSEDTAMASNDTPAFANNEIMLKCEGLTRI